VLRRRQPRAPLRAWAGQALLPRRVGVARQALQEGRQGELLLALLLP
jgi:hypothetical protein